MKKRVIALGVLVAVLMLAGLSCNGEEQQRLTAQSTLEQVLKRETLKVGMSTFVPWAMKDKTGKLVGFEIDVATRLAEDTGVQVEFVPTNWDGIIPALLSGKFDVIIGGMGILPSRNLKVNFTIPYETSGMSLVANKALAGNFRTLEDFNRPEVTLAVRLGATPAAAAQKFMPKAQLIKFDDESKAIQELLNGKAYAVIASAPMPAFQALKYPDKLFLPFKETFTKEPIGFALRKGDLDTLNYFNNWITIRQADGWLAERKHFWFETMDWERLVK
jgi:polar amino acid transport system substrate-binding protein